MKKAVFLFGLFLFSLCLRAQETVTVSGIIKDEKTGESLPFVNIVSQQTGKGTATNVDGYFTLFNVPSDTSTLLISHLGYGTIKHKLEGDVSQPISIEIKPTSVQLKTFEVSETKDKTIEVADDISKITLNPAQLDNLPTLGEVDIFRSLQLLPGISGSNESSSGLYVRGGTPDQNLVLLDGITVYHIDHFFGVFSAFNANAIKDVQMYKGGFEAKYGGRVSSVVDITAKSGNQKEISVGAGVNMLSSNLVIEAPLFNKKASLLVAGRRSYTDILRSPTYNKIFGNIEAEEEAQVSDFGFGVAGFNQVEPEFYFYDLNAKLTLTPTDKDVISFSLYNGLDDLDNSTTQSFGENTELITEDITLWGNTGLGTRWARKWNRKYYTNFIASYSNYFSNYQLANTFKIDTNEFSTGTIQDNSVKDLTFRLDNEWQANANNKLEFGTWITYNDIRYLYTLDDTSTLQDRKDFGMQYAAYAQNTFYLTENFNFKAGVRATYFDVTEKVYLEPRASAYYNVTKRIKLKGAWGQYNQFINRVILENIFGGSRDFWLLSDTANSPVVSADHYILGIAYDHPDFLVDVEVWQKNMDGLLEYTLRFGTLEQNLENPENLFAQGTGIAKGLDVLVQKKFGKFTGWVAYTLSEVTHTFPDLNQGKPFPALHDQRHEAKVIASFKIGDFNLASTFVYGTGKPYTAPVGIYTIRLLNGQERDFIHVGDKNQQRLPDYHRLDFAINYEFNIKQTECKAGVSFFNVYNRENIKYKRFQLLEFDPETFQPQQPELVETDIKLLGFVPNFFFKFRF